ncbi:UDP-N-acetylmuramoyl-tripeptide--D-alanyl-D-alanine ligase [Halothece sp. PCC 7418]|uniref:UDP-N-acetylmuramoyl-tripeptide--D-alanyl-D- alanine ligase n=1 Tax=Halothece sp. (strain PCC 7418) TaxID=65093 RepID=UPI0002A072A5|nr:UDP-N-acetylmuramoyl-tripeptide--D-alanyl-D-alanine ligase [Halothece sp. PCC 7418]AFZ42788.1 UDP-N-acetylmuramoyl-tripeptide--D-alanyl-D-alanine ligase [Halothece sp. PCC 7418]
MIFNLTVPILAKIIQPLNQVLGENWKRKTVIGVNTDTRHLQRGEVFVALVGEKFDGHHFVEKALQAGASALILNRNFSRDLPSDVSQFYVENTLVAYQQIAHWWRKQYQIPVIGITGSVGKTTTKELIAGVLSQYGKVLKTEANENNEIGVPKTLLRLNSDYDYAVVEMAMRARGEIAELTEIAQPTMGLITNVGTAHIGRLGSRQAIAQAKCELLQQMPEDATAILNHDNTRLINTAATVWHGKTLTYGLEGGDLQGRLLDSETLAVADFTFPLPLPGVHNASNYLAALAVAKTLNLDLTPLQQGIQVALPGARSRRYTLDNDIILLDETYNAGVESMMAALQLLKDTPGNRHIAVLGTMKELGEQSEALHRQVGEMVAKLALDHLLVLVDEPETEAIVTGAKSVPSECFQDKTALVERLKEIITPRDRVLFKASNSVGLNEVLDQLRNMI